MIAIPEPAAKQDVDARVQLLFLQGLADAMAEPVLISAPGCAGGAPFVIYANEAATGTMDRPFEHWIGAAFPPSDSFAPDSDHESSGLASRGRRSRYPTLLRRSLVQDLGQWKTAIFRDVEGRCRFIFSVLMESSVHPSAV